VAFLELGLLTGQVTSGDVGALQPERIDEYPFTVRMDQQVRDLELLSTCDEIVFDVVTIGLTKSK